MPITSACSYQKGAAWSKTFSGEASGKESAANHAERLAYDKAFADRARSLSVYLFEQNAFPCVKCIGYFLDKSLAGSTFVFACTANEGCYAKECGFVATADSITDAQDTKIRGVLYAFNGGLYARKKQITVTKSGIDYSFVTNRSINITVMQAIPPALLALPAINVDFG